MEDDDLTDTLNSDSVKPKKTRKKATVEPELKQEMAEVVEKKAEDPNILDPREEFLSILRGMKLSRGIEVVTDVFFNGDVDDPKWLDKTLSLGNIPIKTRELIMTRYYGMSPDAMGVEMIPQSVMSAKAKEDKIEAEKIGKPTTMDDVKQTQAKILRDRLEASNMRRMMDDLDKFENNKDAKPPIQRRVIERPMIHDGEIVMRDGVPVIERIVSEGESIQQMGSSGGGSDMATMLAFLKMSKDDNKAPAVDPNAKPSWAIELENTIRSNKAEDDRRRIEDELKHEKEKREEAEKDHRNEMAKMRESHDKELAKLSDEIRYKVDSMKDSFTADLQHRDEIEGIKEAYGSEFGKLREEINTMHKDVKSAVVGEAVKTGSKVIGKSTDTLDTVIGGAADVFKDLYKAQIATMRGGIGMPMPDTSDDELEGLLK